MLTKGAQKKSIRNIAALLLTLVMAFAMTTNSFADQDQSNYGLCSGAPVSASGTAMLHYCTIVADSTVVISGPVEYDVLP